MIAACPFPWPRGTPIRIHRIAEAVARRGHAVHVVTYHLGEELADPPFVVHRIRDVPAYRRTDPGPTVRKLFQLDPMLAGLLRRLHHEIRFDLVHAHHYEGLLVASHALRGIPIVYDAHTLLTSELPTYPLGLPRGWIRARRPMARPSPASTCRPHHRRQRDDSPRAHDPRRLRARAHARHSQRGGVGALPGRAGDHAGRAHGHLHRQSRPLSGGGPHARGVRPVACAPGRRASDDRDGLAVHTLRGTGAAARRAGRRGPAPGHLSATAGPAGGGDGRRSTLGSDATASRRNCSTTWPPACRSRPSRARRVPLRHEVTGLRVPDGDTAAMADAMERLLTDRALARTLGDAAREQARREFSWDQVAARVEQVYREAIAEAR